MDVPYICRDNPHNIIMEKRTDYAAFSDAVKNAFGEGQDLIRMDFNVAGKSASVFFVDGVIDKELCELNIFSPLKALASLEYPYIDKINAVTRPTTAIKLKNSPEEAAQTVADGDIVVVIDGGEGAFVFSERKYQIRGIQEPPVSNVLRGPREGFIEDFKANCVMIRRRLRTPKLRFLNFKVGRLTNTVVSVAYLSNVADKRIVDEVCKKIKTIDIDGVVESSYVAAFLEESGQSLFDRIGTSEKPDIVCAKLLEGRVAVIVDGSPIVLTLPFVLLEHLQASEDYYVKSFRATLIRTIRIAALLIAVLLPAAYVALQEFQYQMFPLKFLVTIMNSVYGIPLSPMFEMLLVLLIFEILSEASVRMPRYVGMALSIVGAIVLGETAVKAGLLSTPTILIISVSTIGLYCVPDEANTGSVLRLIFVAVAGVLGLLGIILGGIILTAYLVDLRSYGTSYLAPIAPALTGDWNDALFKAGVDELYERPESIPNINKKRLKR